MKVKRLKQVKAKCLCGSTDLRPIFLQVYGCNVDILTRAFERRHKWICRNCESEFFMNQNEERHWDTEFVNSVSVTKESTV